eukprot:COSAG03_NODE_537_length_7096_cov_15.736744_3_plen_74_part_00
MTNPTSCRPCLTVHWIAAQPSYEATATVRNNASKAFSSEKGGREKGSKEKPKKVKDARKVGSGFKSQKRFKRR